MGAIRTSLDDSGAVGVFDVDGDISDAEITAAMKSRYIDGGPPHALWDYSRATFHRIDSAGYTRIAQTAKDLARFRPGGRTAFVAPGDVEVPAIRLLEAISAIVALPIPLRMCATRDEALRWLLHGD